MKNFKGLVSQFKPSKVVVAFAKFDPVTADHNMLILAVNKLSINEGISHKIFVLEGNQLEEAILPVSRRLHYLGRAYPNIQFESVSDMEMALSRLDCKNTTVVTSKDSINTLYESLDVQPIIATDPDTSILGLQIVEAARSGDFSTLKRCLPATITNVDSRMLLNDIRSGLGLAPIKSLFNMPTIALREQYLKGKLFAIGDIVESDETVYKIKKCSSNHLLLQSENGSLVSKWLQDVSKSTKPFILQQDLLEMKFASSCGSSDKIKVARIIASTLGVDSVDKSSNAELLVNTALRKVKPKATRPEYIAVLKKMLQTAADAGIKYDTTIIPVIEVRKV